MLAATQSVVQPHCRATASATLFLVSNLIALGVGPVTAGLLSDRLAGSLGVADGLKWAIACVCLACPLAAACFGAARQKIAADLVS